MKIEIDTKSDSPAELKLMAKFLSELADLGNERANTTGNSRTGTLDSRSEPVESTNVGVDSGRTGPEQVEFERRADLRGDGGDVAGGAGSDGGRDTVGSVLGFSEVGTSSSASAGCEALRPEQETLNERLDRLRALNADGKALEQEDARFLIENDPDYQCSSFDTGLGYLGMNPPKKFLITNDNY